MTRILGKRIVDAARANPDQIALQGDSVRLTYTQLLSGAEALAKKLQILGSGPHSTVMVRFSNHPLDFVALLGVWLAGAVAVPVHRTSPAEVVSSIQAKARAAIGIDLESGRELDDAVFSLNEGTPEHRSVLDDAALVIFTSGSTGTPKGVVLTHSAFAGKLDQHQESFGFSPSDRVLLVLNNTFSFGLWVSLLALSKGSTLVVHSKFTPVGFLTSLADQRISWVGVVPTMMRAMFATLEIKDLDWHARRIRAAGALRDMCIGGEVLSLDLSRTLRELITPAGLYDGYGSTETGTGDTLLLPDEFAAHPDSIGRCMPRIRHRIVNDVGALCEPGAPGELQIDTPYIMAGYLDDLELTKSAFDGPWFKTGDAAVDDGDGHLRIVGRLKELIVRGGNKITPQEIELALCKCRGVASAMVAGVPDPVLGQRIQALIVSEPGFSLNGSELRAELLERLDRYKAPDKCFVATELPTGRTGKLDRRMLQTLIEAEQVQPLANWAV